MLYDLLKNNTVFPGGYHGETMDLMLTNASTNVARRAMRSMSEVSIWCPKKRPPCFNPFKQHGTCYFGHPVVLYFCLTAQSFTSIN